MNYFNLFSNILITKGATRILISDIQRNISELYPLEFFDLINELKNNSIENIVENYDEESREIVHEYIQILLEKEYGFVSENNWDRNFPPLSLEYHDPSIINNLFIETDDINVLKKIKPSVENLGIKHLVIYSLKPLASEDIIEVDKIFYASVLSGIEIFSPFYQNIDPSFIQTLHKNTARIYNLIFYNCPEPPFKAKNEYRFTVQFVKEDVKISACGKVDMKYFNTNLPKVLEAVNYNSCLYKKMGIDRNGNIKNCPLMPESFGNIYEGNPEKALLQKGFKKYWQLTKDHIEGCKDCEFRYVCTDCRAFTEKKHTSKGLDVSKPLKCGYDPYTGIWQDWAKNPLKQKAIQHYYSEELQRSARL